MNKLHILAKFKIHDGQTGPFKVLAAQMLQSVKENEPHTLQFDGFFNDDQTEFATLETYADSEAVFAHLANVGPTVGKLLELCALTLELFGNPSEPLRTANAAMNSKIYSFYQGR